MPTRAEEDSDSEEPSPVKRNERVARAEVALPKNSLAKRINDMNPEQKEDFKRKMKTAFIAKAAREGDNAQLPCRAYTRLNGGRSARTDRVFDSGCTAPIMTKTVIEDMKMKPDPVKEPFEIIQADRTPLWLIGSATIFLESDNLKGWRMLECAVIDGNVS